MTRSYAIVTFEISTLNFVKFKNFVKKEECLKNGPAMPYLGVFGLEFEKTIAMFEIGLLEFALLRSLMQKQSV